jgi:hypothetical protein
MFAVWFRCSPNPDLTCEFANYLALNLARYLAYFAAPNIAV